MTTARADLFRMRCLRCLRYVGRDASVVVEMRLRQPNPDDFSDDNIDVVWLCGRCVKLFHFKLRIKTGT